jgi:hypothetical protein
MEHGLDTEVIVVFTVAVVVWGLVSATLDRLSVTPALASWRSVSSSPTRRCR